LTAHGSYLPFVMERVRKNVMEDERRSAYGEISIGETE
jgi:hypothetical protein